MTGKKIFFTGLGILATIVAVIGIVLPGIPTTLPLVVALWAFSKSSKKMHVWVSSLPVLKYAAVEAERIERERNIDWRAKLIAVGSAWISTITVAALTRNPMMIAFVAASAIICTAFMLYIPTRRLELATAEVNK